MRLAAAGAAQERGAASPFPPCGTCVGSAGVGQAGDGVVAVNTFQILRPDRVVQTLFTACKAYITDDVFDENGMVISLHGDDTFVGPLDERQDGAEPELRSRSTIPWTARG